MIKFGYKNVISVYLLNNNKSFSFKYIYTFDVFFLFINCFLINVTGSVCAVFGNTFITTQNYTLNIS